MLPRWRGVHGSKGLHSLEGCIMVRSCIVGEWCTLVRGAKLKRGAQVVRGCIVGEGSTGSKGMERVDSVEGLHSGRWVHRQFCMVGERCRVEVGMWRGEKRCVEGMEGSSNENEGQGCRERDYSHKQAAQQ